MKNPRQTLAYYYQRGTNWAQKNGGKRAQLYFKTISEPFSRETRAVAAGLAHYQGAAGSGSQLYLLRRNVHMLEKGLTMQPRRNRFGVDYIEATIRAFAEAVDAGTRSGLGAPEYVWMVSVLDEYFTATQDSGDPTITAAREAYARIEVRVIEERGGSGPHAPQAHQDVNTVEVLGDLARGRRSVRWFLDEPVERKYVDKAVEIAAESPTACNRQPYRFEIFDDPESVRKVADIPMGTRGYGHQLPGIIVIVGDLGAFFDERDRHLIYVDGSLAAMSLILGLEAQGISTCCINWPDIVHRDRAMASLLGLQPHERVVMLLAYGYADPQGLVPFSAKREIDSVRKFRSL
ncbi:nitroreductase family protein [Kineococcus sp. SYSU DK001]|uniref:nitroreductase family protein n=1 Tax=Kineococcus sp. SYSU DK001 TaxID=3383122 RepID=UPI003D7DA53B